MSADPALGEYVPTVGGDNSQLPGMGGVFNYVNMHLYHYAGDNPVKYTDPDGKRVITVQEKNLISEVIGYDIGNIRIFGLKKSGISLPFGFIGTIQHTLESPYSSNEINSLFIHEAFHQFQYSKSFFNFFRLIGEQILRIFGVNVYDYGKDAFSSGNSNIQSLDDIKYLEGRAEFVQDFAQSYLSYQEYQAKADGAALFPDLQEQYQSLADRAKASAGKYADVLSNSGLTSTAIEAMRTPTIEGGD